jgi:hypothetical protein
MACREDDVANVGDYQIYEIPWENRSSCRSAPGEIKALYKTSCLHRARKLVHAERVEGGVPVPVSRVQLELRRDVQGQPDRLGLPAVGGPGHAAAGGQGRDLGRVRVRQLRPWRAALAEVIALWLSISNATTGRRVSGRVGAQIVRANWKVTAEAFMESHHSVTTHPQILGSLNDANSQYDLPNDHVSRHFPAGAVASPLPGRTVERAAGARASARHGRTTAGRADGAAAAAGRDGAVAGGRAGAAEPGGADGRDYAHASDAEMLDALLYNVFPNLSVWAGYAGSLCYRWRPERARSRDRDHGRADLRARTEGRAQAEECAGARARS